MTYFDTISNLHGPAVRCGIHDKSLHGKKFNIEDSIKFGDEILREVRSNRQSLSVAEICGIVAWTTVMMTDIIQDVVKAEPTGRAKIVMTILGKGREQTAKHKFDNNRYASEIKKISEVAKAIKKSFPKSNDLVDLFSNMAQNTLGLIDFSETATESRESIAQSQTTAEKNLAKLLKSLNDINNKIYDDFLSDDEGSGKRGKVYSSQPGIRSNLP